MLRSMLEIPTELATSRPMPLPSGASNSFDESRFRRSLSWKRNRVSAVDCNCCACSVDGVSFTGDVSLEASLSCLASLTLLTSVGAGPTLTAKSDDVHVTAQFSSVNNRMRRAACPRVGGKRRRVHESWVR